jgi:hypothetical protein
MYRKSGDLIPASRSVEPVGSDDEQAPPAGATSQPHGRRTAHHRLTYHTGQPRRQGAPNFEHRANEGAIRPLSLFFSAGPGSAIDITRVDDQHRSGMFGAESRIAGDRRLLYGKGRYFLSQVPIFSRYPSFHRVFEW